MLFGNDVKDNNEFFLENKNVINMLLTRLDRHGLFLTKYFQSKFIKANRDKLGRSHSNDDMREDEGLTEIDKFKQSLATPSEDLDKLIYDFAYSLTSNRLSSKASTYLDRYPRAYQFKDIEVFGDISRHGSSWREKLKDELEARYYLNDIIKRKVFDIDQMVYVSYAFNDIDNETQANSVQTPLSFNEDGGYMVEFDALLIRYANTLNEEELDRLMDSICILVTDKVCRLMLEEKSYVKFIKTYVKVLNGSCQFEYAENKMDATINPKAIYMAVLVAKVICDSVNNVKSSNDAKTMDSILNLADISIRNSGSVYGLGRASATIFSYLNRSKVRGRYLERYLDLIVETIEQHKGDIVSSLNRSGRFSFNINPRNMMRNINSNRYCGLECDMIGLEYVYQYSDMIFRLESEEPSKFSVIGLESDNNRLESYKKKSRSELLKNLSDKERVTYNKFESEITRYRSDAINAKDNTRKNALFIRSRGLGKIIALELTKSKNEVYTELLVALDEARFQIDTDLSNRDFNRERNTRLYGQIIPSSDWDY